MDWVDGEPRATDGMRRFCCARSFLLVVVVVWAALLLLMHLVWPRTPVLVSHESATTGCESSTIGAATGQAVQPPTCRRCDAWEHETPGPVTRCTLSLERLLDEARVSPDSLRVSGDGAWLVLKSALEPWRWCSGLTLLGQILVSDESARASLTANECKLQHKLQDVASELGAALGAPAGGMGRVARSSGAFTLLQDCTSPPCCVSELRGFAERHPHAAIFASSAHRRPGAGSEAVDNLWEIRPASQAKSVHRRRKAVRECGGGCMTLQIAHGLQAHPLLRYMDDARDRASVSSAADRPTTATSAANKHELDEPYARSARASPGEPMHGRRLLEWMDRESLAASQEKRAATKVGDAAHGALLRAARQRSGGRVVAARQGRSVVGPAATSTGLGGGGGGGGAGGGGDASSHPAAHAERATGTANRQAALAAAPPAGAQTGAVAMTSGAPRIAEIAEIAETAGGSDNTDTAEVTSDAAMAAEEAASDAAALETHPKALGHLLLSAQRTLLILPAAEAMISALERAESRGLPPWLTHRLRALLPYRTAREMEGWLHDAADAAAGPPVGATSWLRVERVAGDAQRAAFARGCILLLVRPTMLATRPQDGKACPALPLGRPCHAAAAAAAAGGLLLPVAIQVHAHVHAPAHACARACART